MRVCDVCSRHVFASEKVCPFCNAELGEAPQRTVGQRLRKGMSRAQLLAVAAAVTGQTLAGCTEGTEDMAQPVYGAPIPMGGEGGDGMSGGSGGAGGSAGTSGGVGGASGIGVSGGSGGAGNGGEAGDFAQPVYGAPVEDAGIDDAAVDSDAGEDSGEPMIVPLYGASPPQP
jgi:hypothetical protein